MVRDKKQDLAGPGISTYEEVDRILPNDYQAVLPPLERMRALYVIKDYIEKHLCEALNLTMVQVPLIVERESGLNDMLDRDGSRTPVEFPCGLGLERRLNAQVVQAATKWKRPALAQFGCQPGQGICTDMRAVRKDYFLDHDHSSYVDQWDWERAITADMRNLDFLKDVVTKIWKVIRGAGMMAQEMFPKLANTKYDGFPEELKFLHAEELLEMYPTCRGKSARRASCRNTLRSSSSASGTCSPTATRTRCAPPTTTTGSPTPRRRPASRRTASTATSWSGTRSPTGATN